MTQVSIQGGLLYPNLMTATASAQAATIDAATEKIAMMGRLYIDGRPASSKTLSTGNIQWRCSSATFASGTTTVDIGIQDVNAAAGPMGQPDGTFDVKTTLTGGGGGISSGNWNTTTMTTGSKSMTHGDLIAVVWDMTARGGTDTVQISTSQTYFQLSNNYSLPVTNTFLAGAWQTTVTGAAGRVPNVIITFDDGTLGWIDGSIPTNTSGQDSWTDATNPDERGNIFQVQWPCKIDAIWGYLGSADANADFTVKLYSDPTGTPTLLTSFAVEAATLGQGGQRGAFFMPFTSEISLTADTDYIVTVLATGTTNVSIDRFIVGATANRAPITNGLTVRKGTRDGSTGAFTAESPAITIYILGVRISAFDDGTGGATLMAQILM